MIKLSISFKTFLKISILTIPGKHVITRPGPVFCLLLRVCSGYAQPFTGQVIEVTCPVIGRAQPELTLSKRQKTDPELVQNRPQLARFRSCTLYHVYITLLMMRICITGIVMQIAVDALVLFNAMYLTSDALAWLYNIIFDYLQLRDLICLLMRALFLIQTAMVKIAKLFYWQRLVT